ncbi:hypothetical protein BKA62DRAFT_719425 [Auriculariales sp. MPI-PUGE-AT-0066]|nr:hypothetical protein BKA62DRAFT_719425 [Auriculariales sp. MPI-PUGE-AT-0066]
MPTDKAERPQDTRLPFEVLSLILHLGPRRMVLRAARVCQHWRSIATVHDEFYKVVFLEVRDPQDFGAVCIALANYVSHLRRVGSALAACLPRIKDLTLDGLNSDIMCSLLGAVCLAPAPILRRLSLPSRIVVPNQIFRGSAPRLANLCLTDAIDMENTPIPALAQVKTLKAGEGVSVPDGFNGLAVTFTSGLIYETTRNGWTARCTHLKKVSKQLCASSPAKRHPRSVHYSSRLKRFFHRLAQSSPQQSARWFMFIAAMADGIDSLETLRIDIIECMKSSNVFWPPQFEIGQKLVSLPLPTTLQGTLNTPMLKNVWIVRQSHDSATSNEDDGLICIRLVPARVGSDEISLTSASVVAFGVLLGLQSEGRQSSLPELKLWQVRLEKTPPLETMFSTITQASSFPWGVVGSYEPHAGSNK